MIPSGVIASSARWRMATIRNSFRTSTLLVEQSAQSTNKIDRPQMRVTLQHPKLFVSADGAHLGNIEPALE